MYKESVPKPECGESILEILFPGQLNRAGGGEFGGYICIKLLIIVTLVCKSKTNRKTGRY